MSLTGLAAALAADPALAEAAQAAADGEPNLDLSAPPGARAPVIARLADRCPGVLLVVEVACDEGLLSAVYVLIVVCRVWLHSCIDGLSDRANPFRLVVHLSQLVLDRLYR